MTKLIITEGRTPSRRAGEEHWRAALYHAPEDFMIFFFPHLSSKYDWAHAPRFKEDGVMELRARGKRVRWHLYHVRVQFAYEADLVWQVFDDNFWISKENHDRPVGNLVLFADDDDPSWRPRIIRLPGPRCSCCAPGRLAVM